MRGGTWQGAEGWNTANCMDTLNEGAVWPLHPQRLALDGVQHLEEQCFQQAPPRARRPPRVPRRIVRRPSAGWDGENDLPTPLRHLHTVGIRLRA